MTAVTKNVYFDVLDNIDGNYNNTFHIIVGMKPTDVKSDSFAEYNVDSNGKDPSKIKNTVPWTWAISRHFSKHFSTTSKW